MVPFRRSAAGLVILFAMTLVFAGEPPTNVHADTPALTSPDRKGAPREDRRGGAQPTPKARPRLALLFTAPADAPRPGSSRGAGRPRGPVRSYEFMQVDRLGHTRFLQGYADSLGDEILSPHAQGTPETVWLDPADTELTTTIFVVSRGWSGLASARSNGVTLAALLHRPAAGSPAPLEGTRLPVPIVAHPPERSAEAALEMVMRYYGAGPGSVRKAWRGRASPPSSIGSLAVAARRAGYAAAIVTLTPDSLIALVASRVPPIVVYRNGPDSSAAVHFGVVTGWDSARDTFTLQDGGERPQVVGREELARQWQTAGSKALVVRRGLETRTGGNTGQ